MNTAAYSSGVSPPNEADIEWEMRPGGMFVQTRESGDDDHTDGPMININVAYGSSNHEVYLPAQSSFWDVKKLLAHKTGLKPEQQILFFKGKEKENEENLHMEGVEDKSKLLLLEDAASIESNLEEVRETPRRSSRIVEKVKAAPPAEPKSEPPKKRSRKSSASKKEASEDEAEETKDVEMQEAGETKDDKDLEPEKEVVNENEDKKGAEDADVKESIRPGETTYIAKDEGKSNTADGDLQASKENIDDEGAEGSGVVQNKDVEKIGLPAEETKQEEKIGQPAEETKQEEKIGQPAEDTKQEEKIEQPVEETKQEEKIGQPVEETKQDGGSGEAEKSEAAPTAEKTAEVDGENKEEDNRITREAGGETKEKDATRVHDEANYKVHDMNKAESEVTVNGS